VNVVSLKKQASGLKKFLNHLVATVKRSPTMSNKCPKCDQESLSFEDENSNVLDKPYCFECSDFIKEYKDEDNINPTYYRKKIEVTDFIMEYELDFCSGNVIKYLVRQGKKNPNGLEDLNKAKWYLTRLMKEMENNNEN